MTGVHTCLVKWDDIIAVLRRACPAPGIYGYDMGGDLPRMISMLRDDALIERVAAAIFDADCAYKAKAEPAGQILDAAHKNRSAAIDDIIASIK